MLIDRTHRRWIIASLLILAVSVGFYIPYRVTALNGPSGNSWTGLTYGIIGIFFIFIAGGIGLRKKVRTWRIGKAQTWMRAHIWLGLLSFPMILLHCGFDFGPTGSLAWVMMWLFVIIIGSGVFGLVLQNILPKMLQTRVRKETVFEKIDHVLTQLRWESDWIIAGVCGQLPDDRLDPVKMAEIEKLKDVKKPPKVVKNPAKLPEWFTERGVRLPTRKDKLEPEDGSIPLRDFYLNEVQPYLTGNLVSELRREVKALSAFARVRNLTPPSIHDAVNDIEIICAEHRQLVLQQRIHKWLHYWLLVHGPISWAMMVLSVVHAVAALYY
ncbi:MAG: hypothetical protein P1V97_13785 [Planctomycetota bacterium]|nr:hypothetical protein [Planctomycetota bacterium]